jgi:hypothetical protein
MTDNEQLLAIAATFSAPCVFINDVPPLHPDSAIVTVLGAGPEAAGDRVADQRLVRDSMAGRVPELHYLIDGNPVAVQFWTFDQLRSLLDIFAGAVPTQENKGVLPADTALFRRILTATAVAGEQQLSEYAAELQRSSYSLWYAETFKFYAENGMEDVVGLASVGDHESAAICARDSFMFALEAALALGNDFSTVREDLPARAGRAAGLPVTPDQVLGALTMRGYLDNPESWVLHTARGAERLLLTVEQRWFAPAS